MRFSAWPAPAPWETLLSQWEHVEATGWDGAWIMDHFMPVGAPADAPVSEAWTALAALAARVPRIRLGTMVTGNTYRHPAVLAKMAATVDDVSGGRLVLGLGAGWQRDEHDAYGIELPAVPERLARLEEAVRVILALFAEERASVAGRHYRLSGAPLAPKPVQRPGPPLLIGGGGERVTLRIAARYADEWNVWGLPEQIAAKSAVLDRHCEREGRDPGSIRRTACAQLLVTDDPAEAERARRAGRVTLAGSPEELREVVGRYREIGLDELIIAAYDTSSYGAIALDALDRFIEEVAPPYRE